MAGGALIALLNGAFSHLPRENRLCTSRNSLRRQTSWRCSHTSKKHVSNGGALSLRRRHRRPPGVRNHAQDGFAGLPVFAAAHSLQAGGDFASSSGDVSILRCMDCWMVLLPVALEAADRPQASWNHRASADKFCILSENAAAASAQALAELLLLCDGILTSNLATDRAP